jgi:DNA-binding NarL/FixJ family response regulator
MRLANPLLRVLLVDDEPTVLRSLKRALSTKHPDWQVTILSDPSVVLADIASEPVDVVVSDYEMPGMTGIELLRRLKRYHPTVIRVIVSGKPQERAGAIAPGLVHAWLPKTQGASAIATALEELLQRRDKKRSPRVG